MRTLVPGQRWISNAEPELGLGTLVRIEHRSVQVLFATAGVLRHYALHSAPLTRAEFRPGQRVAGNKQSFVVERVSETGGLLTYHAGDRALPESDLDDTQPISRADERLKSARVDSPERFDFRVLTGRTGRKVSTEVLLRLAGEVPNIVGLKDAAGDPSETARVVAGAPDDFDVYSGDDAMTLPLLAVGAVGVIGTATHWCGPIMGELIARLHERGVYFRSLHLGNVVQTPQGELGLIDIADMKTQRRALGRTQRKRNFAHMLRYAEDRQWLLADEGGELSEGYLRHGTVRWDARELRGILNAG